MGNLTTLADVKTLLQIPSSITTQDAMLNIIIASVSSQIEAYCCRTFGVDDYTENLAPSLTQVLQLQNLPINSVASVTEQGSVLTADQDYFLYSQYAAAGQVYREPGWYGPMLTRGLTYDPFAAAITIEVVYNAGYNLPGDTPDPDAPDLPASIQFAAIQMSAKVYGLAINGALGEAFQSLHEGAEGYSIGAGSGDKMSAELYAMTSGLPVQFASLLNPFRRYAAA